MKLWEVTVDDISYSVAALNLFEAVTLVKSLEVPDYDYDNAEDLIAGLMLGSAQERMVAVDDGRGEVSLWTLFKEAQHSQILCCSEWA